MKPPLELEVRKPATEYIQPSNEVIISFIILIITILIISQIIFKYIQPSNEVIIRLSDSWQSNKSTHTISIISSIISKQFQLLKNMIFSPTYLFRPAVTSIIFECIAIELSKRANIHQSSYQIRPYPPLLPSWYHCAMEFPAFFYFQFWVT